MSVMGPCYPGGLQVQPGWINLALTGFHRVAFGNGNGNGNGGGNGGSNGNGNGGANGGGNGNGSAKAKP